MVVSKAKSNLFDAYARGYDLLYQGKNYEGECDFIEEVFRRFAARDVQSILDLGCGTGGHAIPLASRAYKVFGVDRSEPMVEIARDKAEATGLDDQVQFTVASIQGLSLGNTFDAVISMFAVLGYQVSNKELFGALQTIRQHLEPGGLLVCDFWYGPAVLKHRPTERVKVVQNGEEKIIRLVRPALDLQTHVVSVSYHVFHMRSDRVVEETEEVHPVRYIFRPELEFFLSQAGLRLEHFCPFPAMEEEVNEGTWNVAAVARAV